MTDNVRTGKQRTARYRRARIRNFLFTIGPNRLTGGRLYRRHIAQDVCTREIEISSPNWPAEFDGLRIGHVSDFHLGELLPLERALQVVEQLAALEPDLIACTGDLVDLHHYDAKPVLDALAAADAPLGAALVLGNHDELHCPDTISRMAMEAGVIPLHDEAVELHHNGGKLIMAGIDWAKSAKACSIKVDVACGDFAHLLLAHNPKAFPRASQKGIPLTLSGHTHGGQIAWKNSPLTNLAIAHRHRAGLYSKGNSRLFVTTGVGAWFPLRVNCPAEVAILRMRHGARGKAAA
jgi:uncharacterized protein